MVGERGWAMKLQVNQNHCCESFPIGSTDLGAKHNGSSLRFAGSGLPVEPIALFKYLYVSFVGWL